jgi:hypothetical protein
MNQGLNVVLTEGKKGINKRLMKRPAGLRGLPVT